VTEITTEVVRRWYATWSTTTCATRVVPEHLAEFDRWFAEVTKEAYLDGLRDGITTARRIADYNHVIPSPPEDPTMPATGPTLAQDGLAGPGGTSGRDEPGEPLWEAAEAALDILRPDDALRDAAWGPYRVDLDRLHALLVRAGCPVVCSGGDWHKRCIAKADAAMVALEMRFAETEETD